MSVVIPEVNEMFEVEIARDGSLAFPNYDIEYDLSMVEFGEEETRAVALLFQWQDFGIAGPQQIISSYLKLSEYERIMFGADCAEHVLWVFKEYNKKDQRPEKSIEAARFYANSIGTNRQKIAKSLAVTASKGAIDSAQIAEDEEQKIIKADLNKRNLNKAREKSRVAKTILDAASRAATSAADASNAVSGKSWQSILGTWRYGPLWGVMDSALWSAAVFASANLSRKQEGDAIHYGKLEELAWQVRRFVDCMEAMQSGGPWPPIKATK